MHLFVAARHWPLAVVVAFTLSPALPADDWPQWLGPQRDGVWRETGIIKTLPKDGLPVVWRKPVGEGYAGPAVAAGRVFVTDWVMDKETKKPGSTLPAPSCRGTNTCIASTKRPATSFGHTLTIAPTPSAMPPVHARHRP